jgi:hypothetical protein
VGTAAVIGKVKERRHPTMIAYAIGNIRPMKQYAPFTKGPRVDAGPSGSERPGVTPRLGRVENIAWQVPVFGKP